MKRINIRFERDETLENIEVLIRASEEDAEVRDIAERINSAGLQSIAVTDGSGTLDIVPVSDIILLSVNDKQVSIITEKNRFTARQPLSSLEGSLDPARFVRISRYEIVNLTKVVRYDFTLGGTLRIELAGGMETWASRRCIPQIRRKLAGKE
ncbi:MAG: LytTR family transcriptional regulator DNA-binding domain-containing protein [Ruminiclostridium sp.]|nr:LytTR family transcriptional regulator DNA-binding domain-containing protein [Ruminiclostridium sp.]